MDTNKAAQSFEQEIQRELKKRVKNIFWDSTLGHTILWLSIIASFASAIMVASGQEIFTNPIWLAIIAGIPGLVILVQKTFDFAGRSESGTFYRIELKELKNEYDFGKINAYKAAQKLQEIIRRHESAMMKMNMSNVHTPQYVAEPAVVEYVYRDQRKDATEGNGLAEKALANGNGNGNGSLSSNGIAGNGNGIK